MATETSFIAYFTHASLVVQGVMLLLLAASIVSWTFIFERVKVLRRARQALFDFEQRFWSGGDLSKLYAEISEDENAEGMQGIFHAGFKEFARLRKQNHTLAPNISLEGAQRAMRIALARETDQLEKHLALLATIGSTSPYVGLFGTVWGIMISFHALGNATQATIAMVAPGISEALIATAMGLFAAIPAVVAYNRFTNDVERLLNGYDTFKEEFANILHRQAHASLAA